MPQLAFRTDFRYSLKIAVSLLLQIFISIATYLFPFNVKILTYSDFLVLPQWL